MNTERTRELLHNREGRISNAALDAANVGAMQASCLGKLLL